MCCSQRRVCGNVIAGVFFSAVRLKQEERVREGGEGHVMVPPRP